MITVKNTPVKYKLFRQSISNKSSMPNQTSYGTTVCSTLNDLRN